MKKKFANKIASLIPGASVSKEFNCGSGKWWGISIDGKIIEANPYDELNGAMIWEVCCYSGGRPTALYCEGDPELMAATIQLLVKRAAT
jgi:hypothetical protein